MPAAPVGFPADGSRLRVLLLVDALANNGAMHISVDLASRWAPNGSRLVALRSPPVGEELAAAPSLGVVQLLNTRAGRLAHAVATLRLVAMARRFELVVSGSEIGVALLVGYLAARAARRPFIIAVHADLDRALQEWMPRRFHRLTYAIHRRADGVIAVEPGLVAPLVRNGLPPGRARVVRNGVDGAAIRSAAAASSPDPHADPIIVATGRLAHQKGIDLLVRAHAMVVADLPHRVLLLNDGPERGALEQLVAELGVTGSVDFRGPVPPLPTVAAADLFCLPSRHEGLPLALLEALVLGAPIIAADCCDGVRDALDGGRVGQLVPTEDVPALAAAIAAHLRDQRPLRALAERGPSHARSFDSSAMAASWSLALQELVSGARGGQAA